jgi:hypothetical protein
MSVQELCYALLGWIGRFRGNLKLFFAYILYLTLNLPYFQGQAAAS